MKFCLNYNQFTEHMQCLNEADEWNIIFNEKDTTLLEFLDLHGDKQINLIFSNLSYINFCEEIIKKYNNVKIKFANIDLDELEEKKIAFPFFTDILVNNVDILQRLINLKVTDIYIVEELAFEIKQIANYLHELNINVRVFPNVAQSQWKALPALKKFFIRPEDLKFYESYVDIIEFYEADKTLDVYYDVYKNKQIWFGRLDEIIIDFNSTIDNKYIIPRFAEMRIDCRKRCLRGDHCNRCEQIEKLASSLEKSELVVSRVDL